MAHDVYQFLQGKIKILDPEMGLNVEVPFSPVLLPKKLHETSKMPSGHVLTVKKDGEGVVEEASLEKNQLPDGQSQLYYPSGRVKMEMFYNMGSLHGPVTYFQEDGTVIAKTWFLDGKQQGKAFWYHSNGQLYSLQRFVNGIQEGKQEYYYADGTHKTIQWYKNGLLDGDVVLYSNEGQIIRQYTYAKGIRAKG